MGVATDAPQLAGFQRKYLRGLAHAVKPVVHIGKSGVTDSVLHNVVEALDSHELIKVRFVEHKDERKQLAADIADRSVSALVGVVGHNAIFYRPASEPEQRRIRVPNRPRTAG